MFPCSIRHSITFELSEEEEEEEEEDTVTPLMHSSDLFVDFFLYDACVWVGFRFASRPPPASLVDTAVVTAMDRARRRRSGAAADGESVIEFS